MGRLVLAFVLGFLVWHQAVCYTLLRADRRAKFVAELPLPYVHYATFR